MQHPLLLPEATVGVSVGGGTGASVGGSTGASVGGSTGASVGLGSVGHTLHDSGQWSFKNVPLISLLSQRLFVFFATHLHLLFLGVPLILILNLPVESVHTAAESPNAIENKRMRRESLMIESFRLVYVVSIREKIVILFNIANCIKSML